MSGIEVLSQFCENIRPRYSWSSSDSAFSLTTNENELSDIHSLPMEGTPIITPTSSPASSPIITNAELYDEACSGPITSTSSEFRGLGTPDLSVSSQGSHMRDDRLTIDLENDNTLVTRIVDDALPLGDSSVEEASPPPLPLQHTSNGLSSLSQETYNQALIEDHRDGREQQSSLRGQPILSSTLGPGGTQYNIGTETASVAEAVTPAASALPVSPSPQTAFTSALPEDDGNGLLRQKVREIQTLDVSEKERAWRMHSLMTEKYKASRLHLKGPTTHQKPQAISLEQNNQVSRILTLADAAPSYFNEDEGILGCIHYRRGVKLQCSTCERWYPCRFCHDEKEDHVLIRKDTKNMMCMHCGRAQPAQQSCKYCGEWLSSYYCDKCKLWDDDPIKTIYHCNDCGICRIGRGLGKDFFHCKKCGVCMSIELEGQHRCIERSTDCDCPICGEYMFTSVMTVVFMTCGHSIHHKCYYEHMKNSYRCPTCARSVLNMETQFRFLDHEISCQPLPEPYKYWHCHITCNDCSAKSDVPFHFLGLRCDTCRSYNTREVKLIRPEEESGSSGEAPQAIPPFHMMPDPEMGGSIMFNRGMRGEDPVVTDLASVIREIDMASRNLTSVPNNGGLRTGDASDDSVPSGWFDSQLMRRLRLGHGQASSESTVLTDEQSSEGYLPPASAAATPEGGLASRGVEEECDVTTDSCTDSGSDSGSDDDETSSSGSFEIIRLPFHP